MGTTDHRHAIDILRRQRDHRIARALDMTETPQTRADAGDQANCFALAADLLECHDQTGISLDNWPSARAFVERRIEGPIVENGV